MSEERQLKAFLEAVQSDAGLLEKLKGAADANAVVEVAKAAGFVISAEELQRLAVEVSGQLSDEELQGVAGGAGDDYAAGFIGGGLMGGAIRGVPCCEVVMLGLPRFHGHRSRVHRGDCMGGDECLPVVDRIQAADR